MGQKQKFIIWAVLSLSALAAIVYFGVRPLIYSSPDRTNLDANAPKVRRSIQEQIREELIAPPKTQTPTPTEILKELSAPPPSPVTSSSSSARPSTTPSPQQVLDSLLGPR